MCLILFALQQHPEYPLIVIANRDEYYLRPTQAPHFWPEAPEIFAGKDLQAGGTWMGITRQGRFAAVTNYRDNLDAPDNAISRGDLCKNFLNSDISAEQFLAQIDQQKHRYAGFNLLVGDSQQLFYYSNKQGEIISVPAGVHGLSNGLLNDPWPKVETGKLALADALKAGLSSPALMSVLLDSRSYPDDQLPRTGIELEKERLLSSRFICSEDYGTRNATVLLSNPQHSQYLVKEFYSEGKAGEQRLTEIIHQT